MFDSVKNFFHRYWKVMLACILCFVLGVVLVSCSSFGDVDNVQFGLTNNSASSGAIVMPDDN